MIRWRDLRLAAFTVLLFVGVRIAGQLGAAGESVEPLWPGTGMLLGILIACNGSVRSVVAVIVGGGIGTLVWRGATGDASLFSAMTLLSMLANMSAPVLAYAVLRRRALSGEILDRVSDVILLIFACSLASLVSATMLVIEHRPPVAVEHAWVSWYVATLLSQLVITPMVVIMARLTTDAEQRRFRPRSMEVVLLLGLVAMTSGSVFARGGYPLLFLIFPAVLLATFRLRALGAVVAVAIVAIVAAHATAVGEGPIAHATALHDEQMVLLQLFLACCFLSALPIAAILAERDAQAVELRALADRFKTVVENIGDVIFQIDAAGRWAYLNPAWEALAGPDLQDTIGRPWLEQVLPEDQPGLTRRVAAVLAGERLQVRHMARLVTRNGTRWTEFFVQALHGPGQAVIGATGTLRDVDERKRMEDHAISARRNAEQRAREATLLASTDELTGMANRRAFLRQLDLEIAGAAEFGWPLAVAIFDVDHFKGVNDRHGHVVGDRVLQQVAERAASAVRGGDLIGRLGGEEFAILMPGANAEDAAIVAERLRRAVEGPASPISHLPCVTVSIGLAVHETAQSAEPLLSAADAALYEAKNEGRNRVRIAA